VRQAPTLALLLAAALPAAAEPPTAGRYDAQLCVSLDAAAPSCGPADAQVLRGNRVLVRVSDIVYRLKLNSSQAEVVLMHGAMQIDEFVANYAWTESALEFVDADKRTRYELRLSAAR
jgi:plasmid stabilization system protein ParE